MATVRLTINHGSAEEIYEVTPEGDNVMAGLLTVTTAAYSVHRRQLIAQWETVKEALRRLGVVIPTTPLDDVKPHTFAECTTDPDCPWHRRG